MRAELQIYNILLIRSSASLSIVCRHSVEYTGSVLLSRSPCPRLYNTRGYLTSSSLIPNTNTYDFVTAKRNMQLTMVSLDSLLFSLIILKDL